MTPQGPPATGPKASPDGNSEDRLTRYVEKRDPRQTTEPFGPSAKVAEGPGTWAGRFVVHQHDATRMHWDLRIEVGGALESFAVPKGPTLDPDEKRLAMHTETHPIAYLHFEGVIPAGNYGAGSMIIWDSGGVQFLGTSAEDGLRVGKLDFILSGFKLKGRFALMATGRAAAERSHARGQSSAVTPSQVNQWLLIAKRDPKAPPLIDLVTSRPRSIASGLTVHELEHADEIAAKMAERAKELGAPERPLPSGIVPMHCQLDGRPTNSEDWIYELKLDGARLVATKDGDIVTLHYRSGRAVTASYPEVVRAVRALPARNCVLDGEIVVFDERGRPSFAALMPRIAARRARDIEALERTSPAVFFAFDLLHLMGRDLTALSLLERKALLQELVRGEGHLRYLDHLPERGDALWEFCEQQELEGIVAKRGASRYVPGPTTTGDWKKIKRTQDVDTVVIGYLPDQLGAPRSLLVATYVGGNLRFRGGVGSGLGLAEQKALMTRVPELVQDDPAILGLTLPEMVTWVRPQLVARVRYNDITSGGHFRAPVFEGLRDDVSPPQCVFATPEEMDELWEQRANAEQTGGTRLAARLAQKVHLTNPEKVFFPDDNIKKGDLLDYAAEMTPYFLPFLAGRPVVLVRYPDGVDGKSFYQWRAPEGTPPWLRTLALKDPELAGGDAKAAFLIDDLDALLHIVNLGCIPIHVLASRENTMDSCDFLTVDFDIGDLTFADAVRLALSLREVLEELSLPSFPKTSGQRGLHVLVPLGKGVPFEAAKILCELLGRLVVGRFPDLATMERRKEQRGNRVYVDTGQTGRSRTIVAPYSVRAYPGARVSTPLHWREIHLALDPAAFTIETVPGRVRVGGDPLAGFFDVAPDLNQALSQLARWTKAL